MRFAIVGAGATGAFLGATLARTGEDVTLIARGPHLAAMQAHGIRIRAADEEFVAHPHCTDDLGALREADAAFLTAKAHALPDLAPQLAPHLGARTTLVTAQNGIPWWYFARHGGALEGHRLETVDPGGILSQCIDVQRIVGCVVWPATRILSPGLVEHIEGTRFGIGEPDGSRSERCGAIAEALSRAGLKAPVSRDIRHDIWLKLLGNVAFNPLSALTRATMSDLTEDVRTRAVARGIMVEADAIARALGVQLRITVDQRLAGAEQVGPHKTSMLQDLEQGKPLEIESLVGAVVELGDLVNLPIPHLRTVYACARLLNEAVVGRSRAGVPGA